MMAIWISSFLFAFFLILSSIAAQPHYFQTTANLSTTWTNQESSIRSIDFTDGSRIRVILEEDNFACGFFCNGTCTSYLFAIVINLFNSHKDFPDVIWSANRDYPVKLGAILNLTASGELVLQEVDGSSVWTTNTAGKSIAGINLTDEGNLMLFDVQNLTVWQSFDHPTDCLVPGQKLLQGQKLIPSVSSTNWTAQKDLYSFQVEQKGLFAYVGSNPPQAYYSYLVPEKDTNNTSYLQLFDRSLCFFFFATDRPGYCESVNDLSPEYTLWYVKITPDGHVKAFGWQSTIEAWKLVTDLTDELGKCSFPLVCGSNAICSANETCSCPEKDSFRTVNGMGCSHVTPLTCNATQDQSFIELKNVDYFTYTTDMEDVEMETCKQACLNKCSCKAALFKYDSNSSSGACFLPSQLFTMKKVDVHLNSSAFIKIQISKSKSKLATILGFSIASFVILIVVVGFTIFMVVKRRKMNSEIEEEHLDQVPGMPTRFSYEELKIATENFSKKLGEGGFGSVFEGTLEDGSRIAVKCLHGLLQVKKSFLAEVESIGSIHHVNLVRLRGFCAWKSQRLVVYEFMSNRSLDQWIYHGDRKHVLKWECRKKIILDIAKGLAYLHEECRQKIIHLDIKPQNILLDEDFNAKVSDFGLSKLIDRNQSQVITTMRGTPGYMAPEWLSSIITEKVDVYSFGIVLLEILCGRKNFDKSQPEESWHLLCVFQRCWEQDTLFDIVDRYSEDMHVHVTEVLEMMKVASWCLQTDFTQRPSMSTVINVLEGVLSVESNLDYNFSYPRLQEATVEHEKSSKPVLPSVLSGPRELFEICCIGYNVDDHLKPPAESSSQTSYKDKEAESAVVKDTWLCMDSIVKSWLYDTLSVPLINMIFKRHATTFKVWESLAEVFRDNKASKVIQLDRELRNISIGTSSTTDYYNKIKSLANRLEHMDAKVSDTNLVAYIINRLSPKYRHIVMNIRHRDSPPSCWDARSILICKEQHMLLDEQRDATLTHLYNSSSPNALKVQTSPQNNHNNGGRGGYNKVGRGGRYNRGGRGRGQHGGRFHNGGGNYSYGNSQKRGPRGA
ncbi:unnamed protein product [Lactuca saligna]|uniref:non-specific serine/threonine protein kinase n=1 Tax=Lactuca saligna TaxID=75948 RepID=A0AA35ZPJ4_LACSI|nr:unnamed protein product [Lactuca saligna]